MNDIMIAERAPEAIGRPNERKVSFNGAIVSHNLIPKEAFRLSLWRHALAPGATIALDRPAEDHVFYVLAGEALVGGMPVPAKGAASIGANAVSEVRGGRGGAAVLHYIGHAASRPDKPGGCVHVLAQPWLEHSPNSSHALYFDSSCPACSVWLHMTRGDKGRATQPHYHTEDEIICVVQGEMQFGTRTIAVGGAIGIGHEVVYSFAPGENGLGFVNFRQADPFFLPKGKQREQAESERVLMRALLQRLSEKRRAAAAPA